MSEIDCCAHKKHPPLNDDINKPGQTIWRRVLEGKALIHQVDRLMCQGGRPGKIGYVLNYNLR